MSEENNIIDVTICPEEDCLPSEESMPGVMELTKNLLRDGGNIIGNALKGNNTLVSDEVREKRWSMCQGCPFLQENRCSKCGCFMKVKVAFQTSKCPIDKW